MQERERSLGPWRSSSPGKKSGLHLTSCVASSHLPLGPLFPPRQAGPSCLAYKLPRIQWECMWMYIYRKRLLSEKTSHEDVKE